MRQIFDIGDRVITHPIGGRGVVDDYVPGKIGEYSVRLDGQGSSFFYSWNELTNEPLRDTVGEMKAGFGVVRTRDGARGTVTTPLMVGSYAQHTHNPNDKPTDVVAVRVKLFKGGTVDLCAGQFRRERFLEYLFKRPGMFGAWTWKQAAVRYAAFMAMVPMGLLMDFEEIPWFGYALSGFGLLGMGLMTWGHWRNYTGKQA